MRCERCQMNEGSLRLASVIDGQQEDHYYCLPCARQIMPTNAETNVTYPYSVGGHRMTAEEYIAYQEKRMGDLGEELAKALEVVRVGAALPVPIHTMGDEKQHFCVACRKYSPGHQTIRHATDCPVLWLRRRGIR